MKGNNMNGQSLKLTRPKGCLAIYPEILNGRSIRVVILGDPEGLLYLAEVLRQLATADQKTLSIPDGARFHLHLHPEGQMVEHSVEVELCRADAKGTGEVPSFF
jgi:hypothetical protein